MGHCVWLHSQIRSGFPPGPLSSLRERECNHTHPSQFAVQPRVSGRMGAERALLPSYWESTLTTGLSPLESLESHTQSGADSWCHLNQTAPGRSRTCLLTRAEAETVRLRVKPLPLQTAPAFDCFGGVVQSSRLTPLVLETAVQPVQSSRSQLAGLWEAHT